MSIARHRRTGRRASVVDALEPRTLFAISFAAPATYPVAGDTLTEPALADFNGDGFLDAVTNHVLAGQNSVSVLLNKGDGTFGPQAELTVGATPFQVVTGDFNNDGNQDIATSDIVDGTISVLPGNGDGTFQPRVTTQLGAPAAVGTGATEYMVPVELNGDGNLDLVVNNNSERQLVSMLGDGDGTFTKQDDVTLNTTSFGFIAVGDFSGDGKPDVASNLGNDQALTVYFTDGAGNFAGGVTVPIANSSGTYTAEGVAAGDFNGDGKTDVAMLGAPFSTTDSGILSVFLSNGDGTFLVNPPTQLTITAYDLTAADLDNDGKTDVVASQILSGFQVLRGNGDGTFVVPADVDNTDFAVGGSAAVGDLNKDNKPDLAFTHFTPSTHTLAVLLASEAGGGDGGGGGNETATVTPTVNATLPATVVAGAKVKGAKVSVSIANNGTTAINTPVTVELFASTNTTIDEGDAVIGAPLVKKLKLNPGASKAINVKVPTLPTVPDGDYFLLARTTATGATSGTAASSGTVNIAAPFVDLSGTFGTPLPATLTPGKKSVVPVTITNAGNTVATGSIDLALVARPVSGAGDAELPSSPVKLKLNPGTTKTVKVRFTVPTTLTAGTYNFGATLDASNVLTEKDDANNSLASATAVVVG